MNVVTGAFGYTGSYIARNLLSAGEKVKTLTNRIVRSNPFGDKITIAPFDFTRPDELVRNLEGAETLYNTYWIRFPYKDLTYDQAVANTGTLIRAAGQAGIRRIVHISVTNPSLDSDLPYFRGKALMEKLIVESGLSYTIIRPALIFGAEDILINNIAWCLRHFPVFAVPGKGDYKLQPIYAEDLAGITVNAGHRNENIVIDAIGPETYTFSELVQLIADTVRSKAFILNVSPWLVLVLTKIVSYLVNDVVLTRDEINGLMANLLTTSPATAGCRSANTTHSPPLGQTRLSDWLKQNSETVGISYASELARHYSS
jgi:NADH dehydrogenase